MNSTIIFISIITGAIGSGYFVYGKNQKMIVPLVVGLILCVYPYFFQNVGAVIFIGIILSIIPYFLRF